MKTDAVKVEPFTAPDSNEFRWTDESGEVDLSLIDTMLSLTPAERLRWHDEMNEFIAQQRQIRMARYGFDPAAD